MYLRSLHFLRWLLISLCALFLIPFTFSATAYAANNAIHVTAQTESLAFPKSIEFRLSAVDSSSYIVQAALYIASDDPSNSVPNASHAVTFRQAKTIALDYRDDISGNNFITPGTPMHYYWILQDSAGNTYTGAMQYFMLIDSRFSWQHLTQGQVTVNWYNRPQDFGQTLLADATGDVNRISGALGGNLLHPINLWVYETSSDFHGALSPTSYEWVGGIAFPTLSEAFISVADVSDTTLIRDMPHELTHLVFHQLTAQGILAPTWFDEGLAVYNQQYHEPEMAARLDEALASHTLLRLSNISFNFPSDADSAYLAYAQSWNLISYMYNTFGQPKMARLIQLMNNASSDFSDDLTKAIGEDTLHLENQWRVSLHQSSVLTPADQPTATTQPLTIPPGQLPGTANSTEPVFVSIGVLLIVVPLLLIVYIVIGQRRKRQQVLIGQDAQRILDMAFGQSVATPNQPVMPQPLWSDGTRFSYSPPFPPPLPGAAPGENTVQYPEFPSYPHKEYPQQGQKRQAPQE